MNQQTNQPHKTKGQGWELKTKGQGWKTKKPRDRGGNKKTGVKQKIRDRGGNKKLRYRGKTKLWD